MFIVIGLGNPGRDYVNTRHNIGFDIVDILAENNGITMNRIKFNSIYGEGVIGGEKVILIKPQTYMNNSGRAVLDWYNFYKLPLKNIIVVVDDVDIDFGTIRIRRKGSAGSHNGLKSIIYNLKSEDFARVKIGIGDKKEGQDLASFVLGRFSKEERETIDLAAARAGLAIESIIEHGIEKAMNEFN
ncbi:MAG TPA: aminoacyl-tRNA hydrolase [Tepidimicrobium sp.]|nr:aminoacyl-tRNA hydrolase [Tepidimicrobium sp.]